MIKFNQKNFTCMTPKDVRNFCEKLYERNNGKYQSFSRNWQAKFLLKHSCILSIQFVPSIDRNKTLMKKSQVINYFTSLENAYLKKLNPLLVFNMNETGLSSRSEKGKIYRCVKNAESTFLLFKIEKKKRLSSYFYCFHNFISR